MNASQGKAENDVRASHQRHCVRAAVQMVSLMALRQRQLTEKFFMNVLLSPLLQCLKKPGELDALFFNDWLMDLIDGWIPGCLTDISLDLSRIYIWVFSSIFRWLFRKNDWLDCFIDWWLLTDWNDSLIDDWFDWLKPLLNTRQQWCNRHGNNP